MGYYAVTYSNSLSHHGVKGMKWGVRHDRKSTGKRRSKKKQKVDWSAVASGVLATANLAAGATSIAAILSGNEKLSDISNNVMIGSAAAFLLFDKLKEQDFKLTDKQKKYLKIGAAVAVTGLAVYGAYKLNSLTNVGLSDIRTSFELSDIAHVNEAIVKMSDEDHMSAINQFYGLQDGSSINCARCSAAFDLRKRGYDVASGSVSFGSTPSAISSWYKNPETGNTRAFSAVYDPAASGISRHMTRERCEELLKTGLEKYPEGARGHLLGKYADLEGAHDIIWEIKNGKVVLMDAQIGKIYPSGDVHQGTKFFDPNNIGFLRTDDLDINWDGLLKNDNNFKKPISDKSMTYEQAYKMGKIKNELLSSLDAYLKSETYSEWMRNKANR